MTTKLFYGLALVLALTGSAFAAPVLRAEVTVNSPVVTVGDMFDDAGLLAEEALFRAPAPGTAGIVSVDAVRIAAKLVGLTEFQADGVMRVRVARSATGVDKEMLTALITADLATRGIVAEGVTAIASFDRSDISYNAEDVPNPVTLISLRYMPGSGAFEARFILAGQDAPIDLGGRIELMVEAPHLRQSLPAGTILTTNDIELKLVPLINAETSGSARLEDLVGKALQRQSRAGLMLRTTDVTEPELVSRNDLVTIYFRNGALTLTVKGQALSSASEGELVQVLNLMSKKVLSAVAIADGAVEITSPALNVAGL